MGDGKLEREFVRSALALAGRPEVDRLVVVTDRPFPPAELRGRPLKKKLVYAVTDEGVASQLAARKYNAVVIPAYDYTRVERIKVALVACRSEGLLRDGDSIVALAGLSADRSLDTLIRVRIGSEDEEKRVQVDAVGLAPEFSTQVVEALIHAAMEIGTQGYEGHPVGTILVVGDATAVMEKSRMQILNPFQGMSEADRNVLDPAIRDAVKTFAALDGAFVVREDGVVLAAGRYLQVASTEVKLPMGLGARHAAAAAVTSETRAIAITVSQTTGTVRVFKGGEIALELHQTARRI
ncbi:MAG TPA: diadenylate cyclase [Anaeromyxobacteraceae bacterium]|jgi:DNA integrity scanning protein DisA with diadenylate cyclase activity